MQIYELLRQDHDEIRSILKELIDIRKDDDYRFVLVDQLERLLIPHSRAEESVFYNTIRAVDADKSIVWDGFREHMKAEGLLRILQAKEKGMGDWTETVQKLFQEVSHHIDEEETRLFAQAKNIFTEDEANQMGSAFAKLKPEIQQHGMVKNAIDMITNLLPPRLVNSLRNFKAPSDRSW
jgi:hemerythrin superfamily protein